MIGDKIAAKACSDMVQTYKDFLLARYGFVPEEPDLIKFYKDNNITVRSVSTFNYTTMTVREKGHKVFVLRRWCETNDNSFSLCFRVEKAVLRRSKIGKV